MNDELDKALEWADKTATLSVQEFFNSGGKFRDIGENITTLAAAVRELRETVKTQDEEIARLKLSWDSAEAQIDDVDAELRDVVKENAALCRKLHEAGVNPSLDQALNENDGVYKP